MTTPNHFQLTCQSNGGVVDYVKIADRLFKTETNKFDQEK